MYALAYARNLTLLGAYRSTSCLILIKVCFLQATDPSEKERNMYALAYARNLTLRQRTLEMVLEPSVRSQDALSLLSGVAVRSNTAAHATWDFFTE